MVTDRQKELEKALAMIEKNDQTELPIFRIYDDESAFLLCDTLMKKDTLEKISILLFDGMTCHGGQAIIDGLQDSAVTTLFLLVDDEDFNNDTWRGLPFLHYVELALPVMPTLLIQMHPKDEQFMELGMLIRDVVRKDMKRFGIQIGDTADIVFEGEPVPSFSRKTRRGLRSIQPRRAASEQITDLANYRKIQTSNSVHGCCQGAC